MNGRRIILKDETIIEEGEAGYSQGYLWLWFTGYTMQQAAAMFFDPEKTAHIVFQIEETQDEYDGFTECIVLQIDVDGHISVCMKRREENVQSNT